MIALHVIMYVVLTLEYLGIIYPHDPFFYNTPETVLLYNFQSVRSYFMHVTSLLLYNLFL